MSDVHQDPRYKILFDEESGMWTLDDAEHNAIYSDCEWKTREDVQQRLDLDLACRELSRLIELADNRKDIGAIHGAITCLKANSSGWTPTYLTGNLGPS